MFVADLIEIIIRIIIAPMVAIVLIMTYCLSERSGGFTTPRGFGNVLINSLFLFIPRFAPFLSLTS